MKKHINWLVFSSVAISFAMTVTTLAQASVVQVTAKLEPDPLVVRGRSGGEKSTDCGNIAGSPSQIIQVKESVPYLRFSLQSEGEPTLLIEGPEGRRFCVIADTKSGESPEIAGYWEAGRYSVYVGDRAQGQHPYTLSITRKKDSN